MAKHVAAGGQHSDSTIYGQSLRTASLRLGRRVTGQAMPVLQRPTGSTDGGGFSEASRDAEIFTTIRNIQHSLCGNGAPGEIRTTESPRAARVFCAPRQRKRSHDGTFGHSGHTVSQLLNDLWRAKWAASRSAVQLTYVVPAVSRDVGHIAVEDLSYNHLRQYADALRTSGRSPATVNRRMSILSAVLREAHRQGLIQALPPVPHLKEPPGRERILTEQEEGTVLAYCRRMGNDDCAERRPEWGRMADLVVILLDTGCRLSEVLQAHPENILGDALVVPSARSKSGKGRTVPLTERALQAARRFAAGPPWTVDHAGHIFGKVRRALGLPDVCLHVLRHTCAVRLLTAGVPIYTVSRWLGHSSVKVTERYARHTTGDLAGARDLLERRR